MMAIHAKVRNRRPLLRAAMTLFALPMTFVSANEVGAADPWIVAAAIIRDGGPSGSAIYLKSGLVITAAHLTAVEANMGVRISGIDLPATVLKQGVFEDVDLTLLSVD
jgi:hypothetical protein